MAVDVRRYAADVVEAPDRIRSAPPAVPSVAWPPLLAVAGGAAVLLPPVR